MIFVIQYTYQMKVISPGWLPEWVTIDNIADEWNIFKSIAPLCYKVSN
jgi:hypothetical protein